MNNLIKKVIKLLLKKKKQKYLFILPNKYYINNIKKIYLKYKIKKKEKKLLPNIFITKKKFIEKYTKLKIINNFNLFKIFFKKIKYDNNIINISILKIIKWFFILINDFNYIDNELINIKKFFKNNILYYNISNWYPNKKTNNYFNLKDWKYIYKCYKILNKIIIKKKISYLGFAKKQIINFLKKRKINKKLIFIGNNFFYNSDIKIIEYLYKYKLGYFFFDLNNFFFKKKNLFFKFFKKIKNNKYINKNIK
ncbi:MAG: hypothetical protein NHF95_00860 [Candidatus Shikimatogenerans sp. JK-2022]|nr:hypothetical protein [Candidatus Shikimatogenerans bostrichidophilus]